MTVAPFEVGERIRPNQLVGWTYTGLKGKPDEDPDSVRRYQKGAWVLEIRAFADQSRLARIVAIRTREEDAVWWQNERQRRLDHPSKK